MNQKVEWILSQVWILFAFAIALGASSATVSSVKTSINATYINTTHSGTVVAMDNYIGTVDVLTTIVGPLLVFLLFSWLIIMIWQFRRME